VDRPGAVSEQPMTKSGILGFDNFKKVLGS